MQSNIIKIGITGCANIADRYLIPAILSMPDHYSLFGIASRSEDKAIQFAGKYNITPIIDYENLVESGNIDAIYIPLPNSLHYKWIEASLNNGLHVLVEKPLACNLKETIYLNNLAKEKKLVLLENFQFRFHRQLDEIRRILASGKIGELRLLRSTFGFPPFNDPDNIRYNPKLGGGALLDAGAYTIKVVQLFLGTELSVKAANLVYINDYDVDIWGGAFLNQNKGAVFAEIAFGFDYFYQCNIELLGSKGKISTNRLFTAPPGYPTDIILETDDGKTNYHVEGDNHFTGMLNYFYDLILGNADREAEYMMNVNQARLMDELRQQADEK